VKTFKDMPVRSVTDVWSSQTVVKQDNFLVPETASQGFCEEMGESVAWVSQVNYTDLRLTLSTYSVTLIYLLVGYLLVVVLHTHYSMRDSHSHLNPTDYLLVSGCEWVTARCFLAHSVSQQLGD